MLRVIHRTLLLALAAGLGLWPTGAGAHDASAWGGLFRTRDGGASWFQASAGRVMGGALAVTIDPTAPDDLVLGTDSGLLRSRNGGRDWDLLASDVLLGAALAVSFDTSGQTLLAANASTLAASSDGVHWQSRLLPIGAAPPRALVPAGPAGAFYLLGWNGLFSSDDAGTTWSPLGSGLPGPVSRLLIEPTASGSLVALVDGGIWSSRDGGRTWTPRDRGGLPAGGVEALDRDPGMPARLWAGGADRVFRSDDDGQTWSAVGQPLPDAGTRLHGIAASLDQDGSRLLLSTDRGLYVTTDGGAHWDLLVDNLPGHIEAGPLVFATRQPATLYAGFSVTPYDEVWQNAASGSSALARLARSELVGALAFVLLLGLGAGLALRLLARRSQPPRVQRRLAG